MISYPKCTAINNTRIRDSASVLRLFICKYTLHHNQMFITGIAIYNLVVLALLEVLIMTCSSTNQPMYKTRRLFHMKQHNTMQHYWLYAGKRKFIDGIDGF